MSEQKNHFSPLFDRLAPQEGPVTTAIPGLHLFRVTQSSAPAPMSYEPQILIMAQGRKIIYLDGDSYTYDPFNYVVLTVPLPLQCEVVATKNEPVLGLSIKVDPASIGEILLEDETIRKEGEAFPKGIYSSPLGDQIHDATYRLLQSLTDGRDTKILAPMIIREIIYRILCDEHGWALQALALQSRGFFQVTRVIHKIQNSYNSQFDIKSLAYEAGMSPTTFHTSFKHITGSSPLQYIKNIRLHKAKEFMSKEGMSAYSAAFRVGYESASQFSREYKRLFGNTPARDAIAL